MRKTQPVKFIYSCIQCGWEPDSTTGVHYLCPTCSAENTRDKPPSGTLRVFYDYHSLRSRGITLAGLRKNAFLDLLPLSDAEHLPPLRIGQTPLYEYQPEEDLPVHLFLKDDSQNPTFSYKDRASAVVSAFAAEHGLEVIVTASTGNAGSSMAGICAAQRQKAVVMVPETAPIAKISQVLMYGATLVPVKGTYDDAFELSLAATETFGWYNRNTGYNPLTIEGKKTAAFELAYQMKHRSIDRLFIPVGDGVIISGIYKGFEDLLKLGLLDEMPVLVAVQSERSDNLVRNLELPDFEAVRSATLADSISVDVPRNFFMARHFIHQYHGEGITVSDEEILEASSRLSAHYGIFAEPAAACAFAGLLKYFRMGRLENSSNNVVMLTGSGLKDLKSIQQIIAAPEAINPDIGELKKKMETA
ncbi:MAG: pyridoxal-phosphate dependent enzyme [Bacteroidales bacterium]|nr:pyridoxal-phosphate dependent enzyme [Bacteroidales bacterium]